MIRVFGESLNVPWMAGPIVGNRPPLAPLRISLSIRHSDELACGTGLLTRRADWARFGRCPFSPQLWHSHWIWGKCVPFSLNPTGSTNALPPNTSIAPLLSGGCTVGDAEYDRSDPGDSIEAC